MTNLNKKTENAIINIIADHVIYARFSDGIHTILNASKPDKTFNTLETDYMGVNNALILLGVEDKKLYSILEHSFYDTVCTLNELSESKKLAKTIYHNWLNEIKNYFLTKKQVA